MLPPPWKRATKQPKHAFTSGCVRTVKHSETSWDIRGTLFLETWDTKTMTSCSMFLFNVLVQCYVLLHLEMFWSSSDLSETVRYNFLDLQPIEVKIIINLPWRCCRPSQGLLEFSSLPTTDLNQVRSKRQLSLFIYVQSVVLKPHWKYHGGDLPCWEKEILLLNFSNTGVWV